MAINAGKGKHVGADEQEVTVNIPIVTKEEAAKMEPDLPPKGYRRDEELARRQAELERTGEDVASKVSMFSIDPRKLEADPEILSRLRGDFSFAVSNARKGYHYAWSTVGADMQRKKDLGFEFVKGDDPEAREHAEVYDAISGTAQGLRRIGDVILMRIGMARYEQILTAQAYERYKVQKQADPAIVDVARRQGLRAVPLTDAEIQSMFDRQFARNAAFDVLTESMRDGSLGDLMDKLMKNRGG